MPIVKIYLIKGKTKEYKETVLDVIHSSLVEALKIEDNDRFQRIIEIEDKDFERPSFKTDNFMIIELTIFPGRTKEQKKKAIELITNNLSIKLNIDKGDIFIIINEPPLENFGFGGVQKG